MSWICNRRISGLLEFHFLCVLYSLILFFWFVLVCIHNNQQPAFCNGSLAECGMAIFRPTWQCPQRHNIHQYPLWKVPRVQPCIRKGGTKSTRKKKSFWSSENICVNVEKHHFSLDSQLQESLMHTYISFTKVYGCGSKKGTQKTLLVKGKINQNLWSPKVFFLTQSHISSKTN